MHSSSLQKCDEDVESSECTNSKNHIYKLNQLQSIYYFIIAGLMAFELVVYHVSVEEVFSNVGTLLSQGPNNWAIPCISWAFQIDDWSRID